MYNCITLCTPLLLKEILKWQKEEEEFSHKCHQHASKLVELGQQLIEKQEMEVHNKYKELDQMQKKHVKVEDDINKEVCVTMHTVYISFIIKYFI